MGPERCGTPPRTPHLEDRLLGLFFPLPSFLGSPRFATHLTFPSRWASRHQDPPTAEPAALRPSPRVAAPATSSVSDALVGGARRREAERELGRGAGRGATGAVSRAAGSRLEGSGWEPRRKVGSLPPRWAAIGRELAESACRQVGRGVRARGGGRGRRRSRRGGEWEDGAGARPLTHRLTRRPVAGREGLPRAAPARLFFPGRCPALVPP